MYPGENAREERGTRQRERGRENQTEIAFGCDVRCACGGRRVNGRLEISSLHARSRACMKAWSSHSISRTSGRS